jgi:hypothetical protein
MDCADSLQRPRLVGVQESISAREVARHSLGPCSA